MKLSFAVRSWLMLFVSVIFLVAFTLGGAAMAGMSIGTERLITLLALVVAPGFGSVFGLMSLLRREGWVWMAIIALVLNTLFVLFHLMIVLFAG